MKKRGLDGYVQGDLSPGHQAAEMIASIQNSQQAIVYQKYRPQRVLRSQIAVNPKTRIITVSEEVSGVVGYGQRNNREDDSVVTLSANNAEPVLASRDFHLVATVKFDLKTGTRTHSIEMRKNRGLEQPILMATKTLKPSGKFDNGKILRDDITRKLGTGRGRRLTTVTLGRKRFTVDLGQLCEQAMRQPGSAEEKPSDTALVDILFDETKLTASEAQSLIDQQLPLIKRPIQENGERPTITETSPLAEINDEITRLHESINLSQKTFHQIDTLLARVEITRADADTQMLEGIQQFHQMSIRNNLNKLMASSTLAVKKFETMLGNPKITATEKTQLKNLQRFHNHNIHRLTTFQKTADCLRSPSEKTKQSWRSTGKGRQPAATAHADGSSQRAADKPAAGEPDSELPEDIPGLGG